MSDLPGSDGIFFRSRAVRVVAMRVLPLVYGCQASRSGVSGCADSVLPLGPPVAPDRYALCGRWIRVLDVKSFRTMITACRCWQRLLRSTSRSRTSSMRLP